MHPRITFTELTWIMFIWKNIPKDKEKNSRNQGLRKMTLELILASQQEPAAVHSITFKEDPLPWNSLSQLLLIFSSSNFETFSSATFILMFIHIFIFHNCLWDKTFTFISFLSKRKAKKKEAKREMRMSTYMMRVGVIRGVLSILASVDTST